MRKLTDWSKISNQNIFILRSAHNIYMIVGFTVEFYKFQLPNYIEIIGLIFQRMRLGNQYIWGEGGF